MFDFTFKQKGVWRRYLKVRNAEVVDFFFSSVFFFLCFIIYLSQFDIIFKQTTSVLGKESV